MASVDTSTPSQKTNEVARASAPIYAQPGAGVVPGSFKPAAQPVAGQTGQVKVGTATYSGTARVPGTTMTATEYTRMVTPSAIGSRTGEPAIGTGRVEQFYTTPSGTNVTISSTVYSQGRPITNTTSAGTQLLQQLNPQETRTVNLATGEQYKITQGQINYLPQVQSQVISQQRYDNANEYIKIRGEDIYNATQGTATVAKANELSNLKNYLIKQLGQDEGLRAYGEVVNTYTKQQASSQTLLAGTNVPKVFSEKGIFGPLGQAANLVIGTPQMVINKAYEVSQNPIIQYTLLNPNLVRTPAGIGLNLNKQGGIDFYTPGTTFKEINLDVQQALTNYPKVQGVFQVIKLPETPLGVAATVLGAKGYSELPRVIRVAGYGGVIGKGIFDISTADTSSVAGKQAFGRGIAETALGGIALAGETITYLKEPQVLWERNPDTGRLVKTIQPKAELYSKDVIEQAYGYKMSKGQLFVYKPAAYQVSTPRYNLWALEYSGGAIGKMPDINFVTSPKYYLISGAEGSSGLMVMKPTTTLTGEYAEYSIKPSLIYRERIGLKNPSTYREYSYLEGEQILKEPSSLKNLEPYQKELAGNFFVKDNTQIVQEFSQATKIGRVSVSDNEITFLQRSGVEKFESIARINPFAETETYSYPMSFRNVRAVDSMFPRSGANINEISGISKVGKYPFESQLTTDTSGIVIKGFGKSVPKVFTDYTKAEEAGKVVSLFKTNTVQSGVSDVVETSTGVKFNDLPMIVTGEATQGQSLFQEYGIMESVSAPLIPKTSVSIARAGAPIISKIFGGLAAMNLPLLLPKPSQVPLQIPTVKIIQIPITKNPQNPIIKQPSNQVPIIKQPSNQVNLQTPIQVQNPIQIETPIQTPISPTIITPLTPLTAKTPFDENALMRFRKRRLMGEAYKTFVLKGGKKQYLPGVALKGEAIRKGEKVARESLVATFGVERTNIRLPGIDTGYKPSELAFRGYKIRGTSRIPLKDTFIQKAGTRREGPTIRGGRLASFGERREIAGFRSRRGGGLKLR